MAILVAITSASFVFWMIPSENEAAFTVSNYENYLDGVKNIRSVLEDSIDAEFQKLRDGKISPEEYISVAEITSSQITNQISELVKSKPSEEWQESYIHYMDSLRKFNSQVRETIVYANLIEEGSVEELTETLGNIDELEQQSRELSDKSDQLRP